MLKQKRKLLKHGKGRKLKTASYTGFLADLIVNTTKTPINYKQSFVPTELTVINVTPVYATIPCVAAEQVTIITSHQMITIHSLIANILTIYADSLVHHPVDHLYSYQGAQLYILYGLPASVFGYIRSVLFKSIGRPIPFMDAVLDGDLPTGLFTNELGISSTAFQKLIYTPRGQRPDQEYEGEPLDYTGTIPASVTVTVRRKASAKLNRKKMR